MIDVSFILVNKCESFQLQQNIHFHETLCNKHITNYIFVSSLCVFVIVVVAFEFVLCLRCKLNWYPLFPWQTLFGEEVKVGGLYELVVTTLSGLYRYRIGDVVRVVRFHNSCPVIEFQYRQGQILNMRSEKTTETMMYEALTKVLRGTRKRPHLVDYTCAESILLDFIPSSRAAIEETLTRKTHGSHSTNRNHIGFGGVKPFYVIFVELRGSNGRDAAENDMLSQEVMFTSIALS